MTEFDWKQLCVWFAGDDVGLSSKALALFMIGIPAKTDHPWDPEDLGRCLRLLESFPEWEERVPEMATLSKSWAKLVTRWDDLVQSFEDEVGIDLLKGRPAPKTHDLMKEALGD
jgi:hypothetical protein